MILTAHLGTVSFTPSYLEPVSQSQVHIPDPDPTCVPSLSGIHLLAWEETVFSASDRKLEGPAILLYTKKIQRPDTSLCSSLDSSWFCFPVCFLRNHWA